MSLMGGEMRSTGCADGIPSSLEVGRSSIVNWPESSGSGVRLDSDSAMTSSSTERDGVRYGANQLALIPRRHIGYAS